MRLLLVRHAETRSNQERVLDTAYPGPGLTGNGRRQAAGLAAALADTDIGALYVSPLTRALRTAAPLAAAVALQPRVRQGLSEVEAGRFEGRNDAGAIADYASVAASWVSGRTGARMPGAGTGAEFLARYDAVVAEAAGCGAGTAVLVTHGTAIRVWTACRARNVSLEFVLAHEVPNTGSVVLEGSPGSGWTALSWTGADLPGRAANATVPAGR
ncbi:isomerase [Streptomyces fumigatiscleroticus]|nr:isomerase [Streptomyces fumigatiscleroticus]